MDNSAADGRPAGNVRGAEGLRARVAPTAGSMQNPKSFVRTVPWLRPFPTAPREVAERFQNGYERFVSPLTLSRRVRVVDADGQRWRRNRGGRARNECS
jgi:hypothetical protein